MPQKVLAMLHLIFVAAIGVILLSLDLTVVTVKKGSKVARVSTYGMLGLTLERRQVSVGEGDRLSIVEMGESRFSNTNYYYSVRVVSKDGRSEEVIRKACLFDSRAAIIELGHHL